MSEVTQLEQQLSDAKSLIDLKNKALKLYGNREFKELIMDGFCRDEVVRLTGQSADPALDDRQRADALSMAQAGGHLKRFLSMMVQMATAVERELPELEEAISEAREQEDLEAAEQAAADAGEVGPE